jgi:hypothetical protein
VLVHVPAQQRSGIASRHRIDKLLQRWLHLRTHLLEGPLACAVPHPNRLNVEQIAAVLPIVVEQYSFYAPMFHGLARQQGVPDAVVNGMAGRAGAEVALHGQDKHLHYSRGVTVEEIRNASIALMRLVPTEPATIPKSRDGGSDDAGRDRDSDAEAAAVEGPWKQRGPAMSGVWPDFGQLSDGRTLVMPNVAKSGRCFLASILLRQRACIFNSVLSSIASF